MYFEREAQQTAYLGVLLREQGFANQFDQYELGKELGVGGSSQVMLAQHKSTGERFAMKLINLRGIKIETRKQIEREVALQMRCRNCPNVVRFKEQFICQDLQCIVMEFMDGGDLQQVLAKRKFNPLPVTKARRILQ